MIATLFVLAFVEVMCGSVIMIGILSFIEREASFIPAAIIALVAVGIIIYVMYSMMLVDHSTAETVLSTSIASVISLSLGMFLGARLWE